MSSGVWAIVPAAGIGERMQADCPKQYLRLNDKTILEHTLSRLASHPDINGIVVAIAEDDSWWQTLNLSLECPLLVAIGGEQRSDSVLSALNLLSETIDTDPWVLVHDAARPCLRHEDINHMLTTLNQHDVGGILGVPVSDTVKRTDANGAIVETVERRNLWRAATPQMFRLNTLKAALKSAQQKALVVTDEASEIEHAGLTPMMVEGHADNIKITLPKDLSLAALYLQQQSGEAS